MKHYRPVRDDIIHFLAGSLLKFYDEVDVRKMTMVGEYPDQIIDTAWKAPQSIHAVEFGDYIIRDRDRFVWRGASWFQLFPRGAYVIDHFSDGPLAGVVVKSTIGQIEIQTQHRGIVKHTRLSHITISDALPDDQVWFTMTTLRGDYN